MSAPDGSFVDLSALDAASADQTQASASAPAAPSSIETLLPDVIWKLKETGPPSALYVTIQDSLFLNVINSNPNITKVTLTAKMLMPDGTTQVSQYTLAISNSARAETFQAFQLPECFLLSVHVIVGGGAIAPRRGEVFAQVSILRGNVSDDQLYEILWGGYISAFYDGEWPEGYPEPMVSGRGKDYLVQGAAPAAGANASLVVPYGVRWRISSIQVGLQTSAQVANRQMVLTIMRAGGTAWVVTALPTQAASLSAAYEYAGGLAPSAALAAQVYGPLPFDLALLEGDTIQTNVTNLQSGDTVGAISANVEEWMDITH